MSARVLVADDDEGVRYTLRGVLEDAGLDVDDVSDGDEALAKIAAGERYDILISDLRMPRMDGITLLKKLESERRPGDRGRPKFILVTAHGSERHAVEAMKLGAFDYFRKPFENDELLAVVRRAVESVELLAENERLNGELNLSRSLLFASPAMSRLAVLIQRVAPRDVTVLITGESGTGKERVAESIVRASKRASKPFVRFNCAALTPELAEAELFGHTRGAFTGAHKSRPGLFREADGGTVLLDEIGELDAGSQAKLLRVLQEGELRPVGEDRASKVDVRILAATHRDLARLVADGKFREDLHYRLKVVHLNVPPLRERMEDVPVLAREFLRRSAERFGVGKVRATPEFLTAVCNYSWPGNVRELENAIEALVALSFEGALDLSLLPGEATGPEPADAGDGSLKQRVDAYERGILVAALSVAKGNRSEAARALGIGRATLHEKMAKYGLGGPKT
jgi:two-component system response regulator HydG